MVLHRPSQAIRCGGMDDRPRSISGDGVGVTRSNSKIFGRLNFAEIEHILSIGPFGGMGILGLNPFCRMKYFKKQLLEVFVTMHDQMHLAVKPQLVIWLTLLGDSCVC